MKFELKALPTDGEFVEVFATIVLANGDRTRWTCGGLSRVSPPVVGVWMPVGLDEKASAPEHLLELSREEALGLANELYAACGLTEVPDTLETGDTSSSAAGYFGPEVSAAPIRDNAELLDFFGTYDKIALERHPK